MAIKTVSRSIKKLNDDKYIDVQRVDNLRKIVLSSDKDRNIKMSMDIEVIKVDKDRDNNGKQSIKLTDEEIQQDMDKLIEIPQEQEMNCRAFVKSTTSLLIIQNFSV